MTRVCLVTGASGSLGSALCRLLLRRGYSVIGVYHTQLPAVQSQLAQLIPAEGIFLPIDPAESATLANESAAFMVKANLSERSEVQRVIELSLARCDKVDVLVNTAADVRFLGALSESSASDGAEVQQLVLNAISPVILASELFVSSWKHDPTQNYLNNRNIVNISSVSGLKISRSRGQGFYAASKAALNILTMYQAMELADYCIRANAICPSRWSTPKQLNQVLTTIMKVVEGKETGCVI